MSGRRELQEGLALRTGPPNELKDYRVRRPKVRECKKSRYGVRMEVRPIRAFQYAMLKPLSMTSLENFIVRFLVISSVLFSICFSGCASRSSDIVAAYVSPVTYERWTCGQLSEEAARLSSRAAIAAGVQDEKATGDAWKTGAAIVLFWPVAFAMSGDGANAAELGRLKGEMDAVEQASIRKNCNIQFSKAPPQQ